MIGKWGNYINKKIYKREWIILHSFTDVSDNSLGMYLYLKKNKKNLVERYKFIWLINDIKKIDNYKKVINNYGIMDIEDTVFIKRISLRGIFYFMKSKYIFCTHGVNKFIEMSKNQMNINLWHGMPLKNIGFLDGKEESSIYKSKYNIATSKSFQKIIKEAFNAENVLIAGQPRNDLFFMNSKFDKELIEQRNIIWMPTYRKSKIGDIREDGKTENLIKDILDFQNLQKLNETLKMKKFNLIIKPHPMDSIEIDKSKLSNIKIIYNEDLEKKGINLYTILKNSEALITDYSSVYIDYLILNKPMGFVIDDISEYGLGRGFVFENPLDYMPGEKIKNCKEFDNFINNILNKEDEYEEERIKVNEIFNEIKEGESCEIIAKAIGLLKE